MTFQKPFRKLTTTALASSFFASMLAIAPASAVVNVVLPSTANGVNNNDLLVYACPDSLFVHAPAPVNPDGYSAIDLAQPGRFKWELSLDGTQIIIPDESSDFAYSERMTYTEETWAVGEQLDLTLTAVMDGGSIITYTSSDLDFSTVVANPSFSAGSGTMDDPFVIKNQADLNRMRCHQDAFFELGNDISLTGKWLPIGSNDEKWRGKLDGNGFAIHGLNAGNPTMANMGLFGFIEKSTIKNLELVNPVVVGYSDTGALLGYGETSTSILDVKIDNALVSGYHQVGLLAGRLDNSGFVTGNNVEGIISSTPRTRKSFNIWSEQYELAFLGLSDIGGLVGNDSGDGTTYLNNSVDVEINITTEKDIISMAIADSLTFNETGSVYEIGGFFGETDEDGTYFYNDVTADISVEAFGRVEQIGGAIGDTEGDISNFNIDANIEIIHLGILAEDEYQAVSQIGGAIGYSDDMTVTNSNVESSILIETANPTNNLLGLTFNDSYGGVYSQDTFRVSDIGGMGGEWDDNANDIYNRLKTDIQIKNVGQIENVSGYVGSLDSRGSVGYTDIFSSGSISVNASTSITNVSGYTNLFNDATLSAHRLFSAVSIDTSGTASLENVNPFVGYVEYPAAQAAYSSYWDASLNSTANPAGYPAKPATTSQLKNVVFLKATGMDFDNIWKIESGKYPELREGVYTWGFAGSSGGNTGSSGGNTVIVTGPEVLVPRDVIMPETAMSNSRVIVKGAFLNTVTGVTLDGSPVDYTIKTDGTLAFDIPAMGVGKYQVVIRSQKTGSVVYKQLEVTPNIVVKALKGQIRIKATGLLGKTITWKVAGKSESKFVNNNITLIKAPTAVAGKNVRVTITIDGVKYSSQKVLTK